MTTTGDDLYIRDRVQRAPFANEPLKVGLVTSVYQGGRDGLGNALQFYEVSWDSGYVERGYLRGGLVKVFVLPPILIPGVKS